MCHKEGREGLPFQKGMAQRITNEDGDIEDLTRKSTTPSHHKKRRYIRQGHDNKAITLVGFEGATTIDVEQLLLRNIEGGQMDVDILSSGAHSAVAVANRDSSFVREWN